MSKLLKHPVVMFILVLGCAISLLVAASLSEKDGGNDGASSARAAAQPNTPP